MNKGGVPKSRRVAGKPAHASKRVKGGYDTTVQELSRETDKVNKMRKGKHVVKCIVYDMSDFLRSCVDRYLELANKHVTSLRTVATPFIETAQEDHETEPKGELQPIAARILMKILYAARMARYDLLRPTCYVATMITMWTKRCDRALHKLVCYINSSLDVRMTSWVGDPIKDWELVAYSDADLAGDYETSRSTIGVFLCVIGPRTFITLQGISKRQTCVSHSTPEAEIVAADHAIRADYGRN
jgi:hypothetical protein